MSQKGHSAGLSTGARLTIKGNFGREKLSARSPPSIMEGATTFMEKIVTRLFPDHPLRLQYDHKNVQWTFPSSALMSWKRLFSPCRTARLLDLVGSLTRLLRKYFPLIHRCC